MSAEERNRFRARGRAIAAAVVVPFWLISGGLLFAAVSAHADEHPFTVTAEGVSLPAGQTFPDGGHVNLIATAPHTDLHFEEKCIARVDAECATLHAAAQFIGTSFIPWSAFGLTDGCVSWVQVAGIPKHFGDAGEAPICLGGTPSATPTQPAATPDPTGTLPTASPSPSPSSTATPEPSPSPTPSVTSSPTSPSPSASTESSSPTNGRTPSTSQEAVAPISAPDRLADTGRHPTIWDLAIVMGATTLIGLGLFGIARRANP